MLKLKIRKAQIKDMLKSEGLTVSKRRKALRLLWYIKGAVNHNLSLESLREIYETYKRLDLIPEGYMYASLHMHSEAPLHI